MTFPPLPQSRLTYHVASLKPSHQIQGANFHRDLALPNVLDLEQPQCDTPSTLQSMPKPVQKTVFSCSKDGPTRINQHLSQWEQITSDREILSIVKGFQVDFNSPPVQSYPPVTRAGLSESQLSNAEVQELLKKETIQEVNPSDQGFYSRLFLVPKKEGT